MPNPNGNSNVLSIANVFSFHVVFCFANVFIIANVQCVTNVHGIAYIHRIADRLNVVDSNSNCNCYDDIVRDYHRVKHTKLYIHGKCDRKHNYERKCIPVSNYISQQKWVCNSDRDSN